MLRWVLWLAVACAAILAALAISRGVDFASDPEPKPKAPSVEAAAEPAVTAAPEPAIPVAPPAPTDEELQVQEDAAATGMTTLEPEPEPEVSTESAPPPETPPT